MTWVRLCVPALEKSFWLCNPKRNEAGFETQLRKKFDHVALEFVVQAKPTDGILVLKSKPAAARLTRSDTCGAAKVNVKNFNPAGPISGEGILNSAAGRPTCLRLGRC